MIADVRDRQRCSRVFARFRPHAVFHAAAHKHVPLMEANVAEAVTNNVLGTRNVAELCAEHGVEHFVLISTDKAVRPTNVMGATKRVAEQIVQLRRGGAGAATSSRCGSATCWAAGAAWCRPSSGRSADGGPVTVTHPEMRRYFMTIPEAVQLVLQAAAMGQGGEVFVLDMGEPVKIVDLAEDLIRLSGLEVGRDIEIRFTGTRPGEKLYEELFFNSENAAPTAHPKVLMARNGALPIGVSSVTAELIHAAQAGWGDEELRRLLRRLVPDYEPSLAGTPRAARSGPPATAVPSTGSCRTPDQDQRGGGNPVTRRADPLGPARRMSGPGRATAYLVTQHHHDDRREAREDLGHGADDPQPVLPVVGSFSGTKITPPGCGLGLPSGKKDQRLCTLSTLPLGWVT